MCSDVGFITTGAEAWKGASFPCLIFFYIHQKSNCSKQLSENQYAVWSSCSFLVQLICVKLIYFDSFIVRDNRLRRLCEEGEGVFAFYSGNYWLIVRPKFEEFLEENYLSGQKKYKKGMMEEEDPDN